jgi:ADP-heptose:LPS heptosyltransferase
MEKQIKIHFGHGLGDCTYFAHQLPLYTKRGYEIVVSSNPDKRILFEPCGIEITHERNGAPEVSWDESSPVETLTAGNYYVCNKAGSNIGKDPMPYIGSPQELWKEFCEVKLDIFPYIPAEDWHEARTFLQTLQRPVVLVHTIGNSFQDTKSLSNELTLELYKNLLDRFDGSLVLLDWDNRMQRLSSYRVRHLTDDWKWIEVPTLIALIEEADLLIGIDSGPLHLARYTHTPAIGIFPHTYHYPARVTLPRDNQLAIVPRNSTIQWNQKARIAYNIVHCEGDSITSAFIADNAIKMLSKPLYLNEQQIGADVQLQQFVLDWERGYGNGLSHYVDRHTSYDKLLKLISERFVNPLIVETGCIRGEEDWRGAGYSTYLFGAYLQRTGGQLISVDINKAYCEFARKMTDEINCASVRCEDSVSFLNNFNQPIDVLLLDSLDTEHPNSHQHALAEAQAALKNLHKQSIIIFDDTVYRNREFTGKGAQAVPYLLDNGWEIIYSGYQTILQRKAVPQTLQRPRRLILKNQLSPGDIITLTAAVRDLHLTHPGKFITDVKTSCPALWENNPYLTPLDENDADVEVIQCEYPLIHKSNQVPYHMIHGFRLFLQDMLSVNIEPHAFKGDIHLSAKEKSWMSQVEEIEGMGARFWIIVSGGKWDYTAKWWDPDRAQAVVDYFQGRIRFVQCGEAHHRHPMLKNVIDLVGKTDLRQMVRLMWHADGVICPVTMFMHLAAAIETKPGRALNRPCVVIAGGREPSQWEAYPHHQYLHTNGTLPCCDNGGCWKSRVEPLNDGDEKDKSLCLRPITLKNGLKLPECLDMISAADVIRAVENYLKFETMPFHEVVGTNGHYGQLLLPLPGLSPQTCPHCAAHVESDERFCGACGKDLTALPVLQNKEPLAAHQLYPKAQLMERRR